MMCTPKYTSIKKITNINRLQSFCILKIKFLAESLASCMSRFLDPIVSRSRSTETFVLFIFDS